MSTKATEATIQPTKITEAYAKKFFWDSIHDATKVSRFKVQMYLTVHRKGEEFWRHEWTKAQSPNRVSPATLERHRQTAVDFCFAQTATKKTTKVVPSEHNSHLAEASHRHNVGQQGGGCLVLAGDTVETERGVTYRIDVADDALPSERKAREKRTESKIETERDSRRGSEGETRSKSKSRERNDKARSSGACVSS